MFLRATLITLCLMLAACGSSKRPEALVPVAATATGADVRSVLVATTREFEASTGQFGDKRSAQLGFQHLRISVPASHKVGEIEWPDSYPGNPEKNFVTVANQPINETAFLRAVEANLPPSGEIVVFVHGYNNNHEEAVFRLTQMAVDSGGKLVPIAFTWPSRGQITDYMTDRESMLFSRSKLYDLLQLLSKSPRIRGINLFAHSMGCMLTMEMLVQAKLRGNPEFGGKLHHVILASPDIDVDVFVSQLQMIGKRPRPTTILISRDDKALRVSRKLAGDVVRVGAASATDPKSVETIEKYGLTVIDLTAVETGDRSNHTKFARSGPFLHAMAKTLSSGISSSGNPIGTLLADTAGAVLEVPGNLLRNVTR